MNINDLKAQAFEAKQSYKLGLITRKEATALINPYIEEFNKKSQEIAAKYSMKPKTISFAGFVR